MCFLYFFIPTFANMEHKPVGHIQCLQPWQTQGILGMDTNKGLVCGLCYNSISDYVKHSSDLASKRKRDVGRIMKTHTAKVKKGRTTQVTPDCVHIVTHFQYLAIALHSFG